MIFGEKSVVGPEKAFTSADLYDYVEKLLKEAIQRDRDDKLSNYGWLKSRNLNDPSMERHLDDLRPLIYKMTSENSAAIAVKLDSLTEEHDFTLPSLLTLMKILLREQDSMSLMEKRVGVKEKKRINKVHPELVGRKATVCFIVENTTL
ncbi:hypothetical protein NE865_09209 [Phthorimaea operculella]|nr:hypothetical protein NE865_09209 [Phthorimaea operculella]